MYEKALFIIIVLYCLSFMSLLMQYVIGDVFGITMTNFNGDEIRSDLLAAVNQDQLNTVNTNIISENFTIADTAGAFIAAANVLKELLLLLSGTYIFNFMWILLGGNTTATFIIGPFVTLYALLLARAIIAYIRGI